MTDVTLVQIIGDNGRAIHVGTVGAVLTATVLDQDGTVVDLSGADDVLFLIQKPDGTTLSKDAVFDSDGTDGMVLYLLAAGDINTAGAWSYQVKATWSIPDRDQWSTRISFHVEAPIA